MLNAIKLYDINRIRKPSNVCGWPSVENTAIKHNPMLVLCWERLPVAKNRRLWAPWLVLGLLSIAERADRPSINTHTVRHADAPPEGLQATPCLLSYLSTTHTADCHRIARTGA